MKTRNFVTFYEFLPHIGLHHTRHLGFQQKHTPIMAAAIALRPPWCLPPGTTTNQLANMLRDKTMSLKLENIIVFTMHLLAILRHNDLSMHHACVFAGCISGRC
jgi:hypothetical protein